MLVIFCLFDKRKFVIYTRTVFLLVLHNIDDFTAGAFFTRSHRILGEFIMIGGNSTDASGVLVDAFARWTRRVGSGGDALQKPGGISSCRSDESATFSLDLVPSAIRILEGDAFTARQNSVAVTTMESECLNLTIRNDDQTSILQSVARLRSTNYFDSSDRYRRRKRLDFFDHYGAHALVSIRRFGVYCFYYLPVVCSDEQDVVRFTTWSFHLRINRDLGESVTELIHE